MDKLLKINRFPIILGVIVAVLYHFGSKNYLLFHTGMEIFSSTIAFSLLLIAFNTYRFSKNDYLMFLGIAYGFIGFFDIMHSLSYKGVGIISGYGANLPTQFWIATRFIESITLLISGFMIKKRLNIHRIFFLYVIISLLIFLSIFVWGIFPDCFIEGQGLTTFKVTSEYVISLILIAALILTLQRRNNFPGNLLTFICLSIVATIVSEMLFTLYIDVYGIPNMLGHIFKTISFYFIYKAIIQVTLQKPYANIFGRMKKVNVALQQKSEELEAAHNQIRENILKAQDLHQRFLPKKFPKVSDLSFAVHYQPAEDIGGDFYNIIRVGDKLVIYLADVSGHGVDGGLLNIFVREILDNYLSCHYRQEEPLSPKKIMDYIKMRYLAEHFPEDYFICLLLGVFNCKQMTFMYSNAGFQIPPCILTNQGKVVSFQCGGLPISSAIEFELLEYQEEILSLKKGSTLLLTTDGLVEEEVAGEMYGEDRLLQIFSENYHRSPDEIVRMINEDFVRFNGSCQGRDDITFLVVQRKE